MKIIFIFLSCVFFLCTASATVCTDALQSSLRDTTKLAGIIMNSGKGVNDLGDYEGCEKINGLVYASLRIQINQNGASFGLCMPQECLKEDFSILIDAAKTYIDNPDVKISISFPSQTVPKVSTGNVIGFIFFGLMLTIAGVGIATEYTSLFNKSDAMEGGQTEKQKTKLGLVFLSFSFTRNIRKIFWGKSNIDDNHLIIFNGIRVLSLLYLIFGQGYISVIQSPVSDLEEPDRILHNWPIFIIVGAFYAVDVFFLLSGFLSAYVMLNKFFISSCFNIPMIYFHRIYRLIFPVLFSVLFVITFVYFLGDGPIWKSEMEQIIDPCYRKFWEPVLFVQNLVPTTDKTKCLRWLWYVSSDMQAFLFVPFQILAYKKRRYLGYGITYFILFLTVAGSFIVSATDKLSISPISDPNYLQSLYLRPWIRIGAYEIGVLFGMFYFEWMNRSNNEAFHESFGTKIFTKVYNSRCVRYVLYVVGFAIINILMIIQYVEGRNLRNPKQYFSQQFHNIFNGFSKQLFALSLMLILIGPLTGRNQFLRWALGSSGYTPWSRITFVGYIIHLLVIKIFYAQMRQSTYPSDKTILFTNCALAFLIFMISIPFSALFESPFMQLKKLVLFPEKPKEDFDNSLDSKSSYVSDNKDKINS